MNDFRLSSLGLWTILSYTLDYPFLDFGLSQNRAQLFGKSHAPILRFLFFFYCGQIQALGAGILEDGLNYLVDNLVEVGLLDAAEATLDITLYVTGDYLALHEAGLRKSEAIDHVVA